MFCVGQPKMQLYEVRRWKNRDLTNFRHWNRKWQNICKTFQKNAALIIFSLSSSINQPLNPIRLANFWKLYDMVIRCPSCSSENCFYDKTHLKIRYLRCFDCDFVFSESFGTSANHLGLGDEYTKKWETFFHTLITTKINNIHECAPRVLYMDYSSSFADHLKNNW